MKNRKNTDLLIVETVQNPVAINYELSHRVISILRYHSAHARKLLQAPDCCACALVEASRVSRSSSGQEAKDGQELSIGI